MNDSLSRMLRGALVCLGAAHGVACQEPPPPASRPASAPAAQLPSLAGLARQARAALYTRPAESLDILGFRAHLMILMRGKQTFEVEARQDFLFPGSIRTEIRERGLSLLRGHDGTDYWQARPGRPLLDLREREYQKDRARVREEMRLAGQVIRLFQVDQLLGRLGQPAALREEAIEVLEGDRLAERRCLVAEGDLEEFPFYSIRDRDGEPYQGPARIRIWLDRESTEPRQVHAWPAFARTPEAILVHGEWFQLGDIRPDPSGRLRVPTHFRLRILSPKTDRLVTVLEVDLKDLEINPAFPPEHFSRKAGAAFAKDK